VAVRQVQAAHEDAVGGGLDVAAVLVVGIAGKRADALLRFFVAGEDRHAVPRLLSVEDRAIARLLQRRCGKLLVHGLQLLQAGHVRRLLLEPLQQVREPDADAVNVVGCYLERLHRGKDSKAWNPGMRSWWAWVLPEARHFTSLRSAACACSASTVSTRRTRPAPRTATRASRGWRSAKARSTCRSRCAPTS